MVFEWWRAIDVDQVLVAGYFFFFIVFRFIRNSSRRELITVDCSPFIKYTVHLKCVGTHQHGTEPLAWSLCSNGLGLSDCFSSMFYSHCNTNECFFFYKSFVVVVVVVTFYIYACCGLACCLFFSHRLIFRLANQYRNFARVQRHLQQKIANRNQLPHVYSCIYTYELSVVTQSRQ